MDTTFVFLSPKSSFFLFTLFSADTQHIDLSICRMCRLRRVKCDCETCELRSLVAFPTHLINSKTDLQDTRVRLMGIAV